MATNPLLSTIETDLTAAWGDLSALVEVDALVLWGDFKTILTSMQPSQFAILKGLVETAIKDVAIGDNISQIETSVLNQAAQQEIPWLEQLGSATLQAVIAVIVASIPVPKAT